MLEVFLTHRFGVRTGSKEVVIMDDRGLLQISFEFQHINTGYYHEENMLLCLGKIVWYRACWYASNASLLYNMSSQLRQVESWGTKYGILKGPGRTRGRGKLFSVLCYLITMRPHNTEAAAPASLSPPCMSISPSAEAGENAINTNREVASSRYQHLLPAG